MTTSFVPDVVAAKAPTRRRRSLEYATLALGLTLAGCGRDTPAPTAAPRDGDDAATGPAPATSDAADRAAMTTAEAATFVAELVRAAEAAHPHPTTRALDRYEDGPRGLYRSDEDLSAAGPCQRPDATMDASLRARLGAWVEQVTRAAGERVPRGTDDYDQPLEGVSIGIGCVEEGGVLALVHDRRTSRRGAGEGDRFHSWLVRVGTRITVIDQVRSSHLSWLEVVALQDLDGDGAVEAVYARHDVPYEWGNARLWLAPSAGRAHPLETGWEEETSDVFRRDDVAGDVVVIESELVQQGRSEYACVLPPGLIAPCPASAALTRGQAIEQAINTLDAVEPPQLGGLHRHELAAAMATLSVPADRAAAVIAAAPHAPRGEVARAVAQAAADAGIDADRASAALESFDEDELATPGYRERIRAALVELGASPVEIDEVVGER